MRWLFVAVVLVGCTRHRPGWPDQARPPADLSVAGGDLASPAADLAGAAAAADLAVADLAEADLAHVDLAMTLPCGEPEMQCCVDKSKPACNPMTATCNQFGVCVACGLYPMACCPGGGCRADQTCLDDPGVGAFCYPCGHDGQPCCFVGDACVEPGTSCITPDASTPVCSH